MKRTEAVELCLEAWLKCLVAAYGLIRVGQNSPQVHWSLTSK